MFPITWWGKLFVLSMIVFGVAVLPGLLSDLTSKEAPNEDGANHSAAELMPLKEQSPVSMGPVFNALGYQWCRSKLQVLPTKKLQDIAAVLQAEGIRDPNASEAPDPDVIVATLMDRLFGPPPAEVTLSCQAQCPSKPGGTQRYHVSPAVDSIAKALSNDQET